MITVYKNLIVEGLRSASDRNYQKQCLANPTGHYIWLPIEDMEVTFGDSGLGDALDANQPVFGTVADQALRELYDAMQKIDYRLSESEIFEIPTMQNVREKAAKALQLVLKSKLPENTNVKLFVPIYIHVINNNGQAATRKALAVELPGDRFEVYKTDQYWPPQQREAGLQWQFNPGDIVRCQEQHDKSLLAVAKALP